eukprot:scaffold5526_cov123-Isochrysis_galbana.AAC.3
MLYCSAAAEMSSDAEMVWSPSRWNIWLPARVRVSTASARRSRTRSSRHLSYMSRCVRLSSNAMPIAIEWKRQSPVPWTCNRRWQRGGAVRTGSENGDEGRSWHRQPRQHAHLLHAEGRVAAWSADLRLELQKYLRIESCACAHDALLKHPGKT